MVPRSNKSFLRRFPWVLPVAAYSLIVIVLHWDIVTHLSSRVLAGSRAGAMFTWEFWWFYEGFRQFSPMERFYTTALMFPAGTPLLVHAPVIWASAMAIQVVASPYAAYNLLHLFAFVASGASMFWLARRVSGDSEASFLAGYLYMFSHYSLVQHRLGHLGESAVFFVPLMFGGLLELLDKPRKRSFGLFLIGGLGTCLTTTYVAFAALGVGLPVFLAARMRGRWGALAQRQLALPLAGSLFLILLTGLAAYWRVLGLGPDLIGGSTHFSLSVLSFLDFPSWHSSDAVQALRGWTSGGFDAGLLERADFLGRTAVAAKARSENLMGFFGLSTWVLVIWGWRRRALRESGAWVLLALCGAVMSLGPWLQWNYEPGRVPLPYLLFDRLPLLGVFRTPSRMILLASLGLSVLAAVSFADLRRSFKRDWARLGLLAAFICVYSWEMGLGAIGRRAFTVRPGAVYDRLAVDPAQSPILELPVGITRSGDVTVNAQEFMLYQPRHGKPLVLGRPPRHTRRSLEFCENTDVVYELTHPHVLAGLYGREKLHDRLQHLKRSGRDVLRKNNIRYVLFHERDTFFSDEVMRRYDRFLGDVLGSPEFTDETGVRLYRVF